MELQKAFCKLKGYPVFVSLDGKCFKCNKSIPDSDKELITGCPFCNYSFVE